MGDDVSMESDDSEQVPGKLRSSKRKRALDIPDLKDMYQANDNMLPHPIVDDVVVFMKRDGSGVRLGCVQEIDNKLKSNPMYTKYLCGSTAKLDAIPSLKRVVRCLEEVVLVDRPFFIGDTVVRFENAYMGEAKERERWCKESQIGTVINVKCMADLLVMPSKNVVVENIPIEGENVEMINHSASHNLLMYENSIGDAKNCVNEVTLRYKDTHTVIVRESSQEEYVDGVYLMRKDPTDEAKALVKGEVVGMSVEDAIGKFARWPDGIPLMLKRKKTALRRREQTEHFTIEKVRAVALDVKWIFTTGHPDSKPDKRIEGEDISKVHRFEPHVNTRFDPSDRIIVKTTDQAKAFSKRDYFTKLTTKYKDKFEKRDQLAAEDLPSSSGQSSSVDGVCAKAAKLSTDAPKSQSEIERDEQNGETEKGKDEAGIGENSSSDEDEPKKAPGRRSSRLTAQRRATRASCVPEKLQDGSCSAKELLGDEFIGEVLLTRTVVDVEWLDGSVSRDIPSYELSRKEVDFDQAHHMPGSTVINKDFLETEYSSAARFGIILTTNDAERCCTVRWFKRSANPPWKWDEVGNETISLFDIMRHPLLERGELGMFALRASFSDELRDSTMQAVENLKNGKQKFRLSDGSFHEAWPNELSWLPHLDEIVDHEHDDDMSVGSDVSDDYTPLALTNSKEKSRDRRVEAFLLFMRSDPEYEGLVMNRMRWFEAMILLARCTTISTIMNDTICPDALEFAGYMHEYRHEAKKGDSLCAWIRTKFETSSEEEKAALRKRSLRIYVLTKKYPTWFKFMSKDLSNRVLFALWSYLDSQKKLRRELFGQRRNVTMKELEEALGEKVDEYYSMAAWEEVTASEALGMFDESSPILSEYFNGAPRDMDSNHSTRMIANHIFHPSMDTFVENGLLDQYRNNSAQMPVNTWQHVYDSSGELKEHYDKLLKNAPHTLRLKICGDSAVGMTDCFIWYHVLHQILQSPNKLPTTIFIEPSMEVSFEDDNSCWAIMSRIILMQAGIMVGPFYEYFPDHMKEYNYDVIERALASSPEWGIYPLQLAAIYDYAVRTDLRSRSACLNIFERFFPLKDILATVRHALSEATVDKPVCVVMESEVKEYTSGKRTATAEQLEELQKWTTDTRPQTVTAQKEGPFEVLSECPYSHKFHSASSGEGGVGRAFYTAVRKEHRLLREHIPEGIHVRAYEDRTDCLSFLIIGPTGTPYEGVPFMFDVKLPETYPEKPPEVHYVSYSAEQLNPNLYLCGKVCTSLLGTWSGEGVETWNAKNSNLLQVILSIQALILVREPYFNEAGYESRKDLPESGPNSKRYNETAAVNALEYLWKVIGADIFPFSDVIHKHVVCTWSGLREKLLRLSKDENSMPDYPVLGSKGFRLAIEKAVHRVDLRVNSELSAKLGSASIDADATSTTNDELATGTQIKEKVWPAVQEDADEYERAEGTIDLLSGYRDVRRFEFTKPVTCFMLRQE